MILLPVSVYAFFLYQNLLFFFWYAKHFLTMKNKFYK